MLLLNKPSDDIVRQFIASQQELPFSYRAVGATQDKPPAGFTVDHNRIKLGAGKETYERARAALQSWQQFDLGWVTVRPSRMPLEVGTIVAVQARALGLWWLNAARIVYVIDETEGRDARYGFAYGTLPDHVERGEERFTVQWRKDEDDSVWYDIYAFSRTRHPLARLGLPITRKLQKRFVADSLAVMKRTAAD
ncbi:MAG TPA: DUF1990 domain-containing protein [Pyrinomonadaceae bacterium]|jgi:uncharacterized protein (UPF0548 family)|nr:DUF1990 domain-containing protein [Pyrinomonadaceae bacterium]